MVVFGADVHARKRPATPRPPLTCVILNHPLASTRFLRHCCRHHRHHHHCQLRSISQGAGGKRYSGGGNWGMGEWWWLGGWSEQNACVDVSSRAFNQMPSSSSLTPPLPPSLPPPLHPSPPPPSPLTVGFDFNGLHRSTDAHPTASEAPKQVCGTKAKRPASLTASACSSS